MNTRTFIKISTASLLGSALPSTSSAEIVIPTSIYDSTEAPPQLVRSFIWWAAGFDAVPNQRYVMCEYSSPFDGKILTVPEPVFGPSHVSESTHRRIAAECNTFWALAKSIIRATKGRCNWHPSVDTDENHVRNCGTNFYSVRHGSEFFMESWPAAERTEFCEIARSFAPMFLEERDGLLEYCEGVPA